MHTRRIKLHTGWHSAENLAGPLLWDSTHASTWLAADVSPLDLLRKGMFIFVLAFLFGVAYPGVAAYFAGVFLERDVQQTIDSIPHLSNPRLWDRAKELKEFDAHQEAISKQIKKLEGHLATLEMNPENLAQVEGALSLYKALQNKKKEAVAPIRLVPFFSIGSTLLLWPAFYTFLAWLIFIFPPPLKKEFSGTVTVKNILLLALSIDILYRWPTWWRNTQLGQEGRIFYGNSNLDVDPLGFYVQESLGVMVALLLAVVWLQWSAYYGQIKARLSSMPNEEPIGEALNPEISEEFSHMFLHWQIVSILLTLAFLWYTVFFWQTVIVYGDMRYVLHAVIVHSMWVITWIIISLPLLVTSYHWHKVRARAMTAVAKMNLAEGYDPDRLATALDRLQPISAWNIAASSIAVVVSLLVPFMKNFLH